MVDWMDTGHRRRRTPLRRLTLAMCVAALLMAGSILWDAIRDQPRSPDELYQAARNARPERAAELYRRLAVALPEIDEYCRLWAAELALPDQEAVDTLRAVIDERPDSPAAFEAHVALARLAAGSDAPEAISYYRAALLLKDSVALRLELARYLEQHGEVGGAYAEYRKVLRQRPDGFADLRRLGSSLDVATDLAGAHYYSDALDALRGTDDPAALPVRAMALEGANRLGEAETAYRAHLERLLSGGGSATPEADEARLGLARVLRGLDRADEALTLLEGVDHPDARQAVAEIVEESDPERALALYLDSPYPLAWWSAATLLEKEGRVVESLPVYGRVGQSDHYLADDAAYRLYVLARRQGDGQAEAKAMALLRAMGPNWLALRASGDGLQLTITSPTSEANNAAEAYHAESKAAALERIGRDDLAYDELTFAAWFSDLPDVRMAMARALAGRDHIVEAQTLAAAHLLRYSEAPLDVWRLSYPIPYEDAVHAAADEFGVDPFLIWAIMRQESRYDPNARSYVGAQGLMQVMPETREWVAEQLGEEIGPEDAYTPEASIRMGAWYLRFVIDYYEGDLELAILAYNGGAGSVDSWRADPRSGDRDDVLRWVGFGETREYIERVFTNWLVYHELYGTDAGS